MKHLPIFALLALLLVSCTAPGERRSAPDVQTTAQTKLDVAGTRYSIVSESSWLRVRVYKTGALARFGHDHVVASTTISGSIVRAQAFKDSAFALNLPLQSLIVDDPDARRAEGALFEKDIPQKDRTATQKNMLGVKLLNAEAFPDIALTSMSVSGSPEQAQADVLVAIAGDEKPVAFAFTLRESGDQLIIEGQTELTHAQLGLEPFSALGGALRVREDIALRYYIVAEREKDML
ncbi:MAG: YceI family protein [Gammaproteobacteria bacterium]